MHPTRIARRLVPLGAGSDSVGALPPAMVHVSWIYVKDYVKIRTYAE